MRFQYSTVGRGQRPSEALPRVEIVLSANGRAQAVIGLVDSGATINVLPYQVGFELGYVWSDVAATIRLAGNLATQKAMPIMASGVLGDYDAVDLAFAWSKSDDVPVIFGQTNFFIEFDVHFYRAEYSFEILPRRRR